MSAKHGQLNTGSAYSGALRHILMLHSIYHIVEGRINLCQPLTPGSRTGADPGLCVLAVNICERKRINSKVLTAKYKKWSEQQIPS